MGPPTPRLFWDIHDLVTVRTSWSRVSLWETDTQARGREVPTRDLKLPGAAEPGPWPTLQDQRLSRRSSCPGLMAFLSRGQSGLGSPELWPPRSGPCAPSPETQSMQVGLQGAPEPRPRIATQRGQEGTPLCHFPNCLVTSSPTRPCAKRSQPRKAAAPPVVVPPGNPHGPQDKDKRRPQGPEDR